MCNVSYIFHGKCSLFYKLIASTPVLQYYSKFYRNSRFVHLLDLSFTILRALKDSWKLFKPLGKIARLAEIFKSFTFIFKSSSRCLLQTKRFIFQKKKFFFSQKKKKKIFFIKKRGKNLKKKEKFGKRGKKIKKRGEVKRN